MTRRRKLGPGYWAAFGALAVAGALIVWNLLTGLAHPWLGLTAAIITVATSLWTFRLLWKQSDPRNRHPGERNTDPNPPAPGD